MKKIGEIHGCPNCRKLVRFRRVGIGSCPKCDATLRFKKATSNEKGTVKLVRVPQSQPQVLTSTG